ncbi:Coagulation factor IX [Larimichthys crocea]|uniref:Coagulation factor IX n=2 Tax=Larimichthys crocea TaxID=215358 RepID=A0A6G0I705_LARCR|nr:coagulation factor IX [Larimichthys crocea]KAE8287318.1 Coagulation factor IX [Larimichthys crocea]TMS13951.1 Coagulation factor IX [Larimichthys crocea]
MAGVCLLVFIASIVLDVYGLPVEIPEENTGGVFVSQHTAHTVLLRRRRYNSGKLEEVLYKDNLERECIEEDCTMEEARECFEDNEKTMEFWARHRDGDQCKPPPCQNEGVCEDGIGGYVCWCKPNFNGKNCEIEVAKQCSVKNGGCSHFCEMQQMLTVCQCAAGYQLGPDRKTCEPTEQFSCGLVSSTPLNPRSLANSPTGKHNFSGTLHHNDYDAILQLYDDYDLSMNDSDLLNISAASSVDIRSSSPVNPSEVLSSGEVSNGTETKQGPSWALPTLPSITEEKNNDHRIVGGNEAKPGEIPWQVVLMCPSATLGRAQPFCGGSLLTELWVITAAHCLTQAETAKQNFFVRVGEHDLNINEGPERDHGVAEKIFHPYYNSTESVYNHDIALLKLTTPVELSNQRRPICLGPKDFIEDLLRASETSMVSGWGRIKFLGIEATKLQKLEVPYVERTVCKQSSRDHITRFMFCAGFRDQLKDSCQGDSGGPHASLYKGTWFLTGIVSWGEECAKDGKYGVYTRVSKYSRWISQTTGIKIS